MKLFVWRQDGVLPQFESGIILAVAPDLETAKKQVMVEAFEAFKRGERAAETESLDDVYLERMWEKWGKEDFEHSLQTEHEEFSLDQPQVFFQEGSA